MLRAGVALLLTVVVLGAIGWLSRAPWDSPGSDRATLRLSWRMQSADAQVCRERTQAELDALPVHMRTPQVCETRPVVYRLESAIDGEPGPIRRVRPAGARGDRPLMVWQETAFAPGPRRLAVRFRREGGAPDEDIALDTVVDARAGEIVLVTLDEAGRLGVRQAGSGDR